MTFGIFAKNSKETIAYFKKEKCKKFNFLTNSFAKLHGGGGDFIFVHTPKKVKKKKNS